MERPVYITEIAERTPKYVGGACIELSLWKDDEIEFWKKISDKKSFTFPNLNSEGFSRFRGLYRAIREKNEEKAKEILNDVEKYTIRGYDEKTNVEKWEHVAVQLPGDIGGPKKEEIKKFLTKKASGRVLEAMCGFNSYFDNSQNISEVIVLDYCRAMLERYAYPERKRVLYDLEKVIKGEKIGFFEDCSFQTIGCWGSNYLSEQLPVFAEFYRILDKKGKFLILESTTEGYSDLVKRYFDPKKCSEVMKKAGFSTKVSYLKWLKTKFELGNYYLVTGTK